jgi:hypothetical protein
VEVKDGMRCFEIMLKSNHKPAFIHTKKNYPLVFTLKFNKLNLMG